MNKLLLICLAIVIALALGCGGQPAKATVKDPVCKMDVDPARALKAERDGKTYYFCSEYCKEQFEKDPAKYAVK